MSMYKIIEKNSQEPSAMEIKAEISWDHLEKFYQKRLEKIAEHAELDGFRKGKAPLEVVEQQVGQMEILQQAAQDALGDAYPAIILEEKLRVLGYPQMAITKIAHGADLEFTALTALMPEIQLPDYKSIAAKHNKEQKKVEISDEEFDQSVQRMRSMYAHSMNPDVVQETGDKDVIQDLPELSDEFVSKLGNYANVEDFTTKFRQELTDQKKHQEDGTRREAIIQAIAQEIHVEIPEVLVESEKDKMLAAIKDDISRMGLEFDAWLNHSQKTEKEMRKEMNEDAKERALADLILKAIAQEESITPQEEDVEAQISAIAEVHKDVPEENIRSYVENIYLNQSVLEFLDKQ